MPLLMLKDLPRYECLLAAAREFPDLDPSATEVFLHLLRAGDEAFRVVESQLARHDLTQGGFSVLMALWGHCQRNGRKEPLSPAGLAERTGVTRATMTGLVDTLQRGGFVRRAPDAEDRRMIIVELTPRGEKLLRKVLPDHFRQMAWLMAPYSENERKTLVRLLTKLLRRTAEDDGRPARETAAASS